MYIEVKSTKLHLVCDGTSLIDGLLSQYGIGHLVSGVTTDDDSNRILEGGKYHDRKYLCLIDVVNSATREFVENFVYKTKILEFKTLSSGVLLEPIDEEYEGII